MGVIALAVTVTAISLGGTAAVSQAACTATEVWTAATGFATDDPAINSAITGGNTTVTVTAGTGKEICSLSGFFSPGATPSSFNVTSAPFTATAPSGATITNFVVQSRDLVTTTTTGPTTSTSSTLATTTTSTIATTTTTAPTTTTTAPPTTLPRGPGQGPFAIRPEGGLETAPDSASVRGFERVDVATLRAGSYQVTTWTGDTWTDWRNLGTPPVGGNGSPSILSWAPGRLDVFVAGGDSRLWQTFSTDGGASWSGWFKPLGDEGEMGSPPKASSRGPGLLDIWVTGTDNQVWQRFWDGASWNHAWLPQGRPPTGILGQTTATSWDGGRVDIFVRGTDNKLWQRSYAGAWGDWIQPVGAEGVLDSSPAATSWESGNLLVFIRGTDGRVYALPFGGIWGTWVRLVGHNDVIIGAPGASSRGSNRFDVFGRGTDNLTYQIWQ